MARIREDLIGSVLLDNPGGDPIVLVAGDEVPDGVELGTHVLAGADHAETPTSTEDTSDAGSAVSGAQDAAQLVIPAKAGAGSSVEAWRAYAAEATKRAGLSIDIPEDAKRADIIAALDDAKIATE